MIDLHLKCPCGAELRMTEDYRHSWKELISAQDWFREAHAGCKPAEPQGKGLWLGRYYDRGVWCEDEGEDWDQMVYVRECAPPESSAGREMIVSDVEKMLDDAAACSQCHNAADEIERLHDLHLHRTQCEHRALEAKDKRIAELESENKRLREALVDMPCDCTKPQFVCARCDVLEAQDEY